MGAASRPRRVRPRGTRQDGPPPSASTPDARKARGRAMQPSSPVPGPSSSPTVVEPSSAVPSGLGGPPHGAGRLVPKALGIGLGVGILSWLIGEAAENAFLPRTVPGRLPNGIPTRIITDSARSVASIRNVSLSSGLFGALLGLALGLAGGLGSRR